MAKKPKKRSWIVRMEQHRIIDIVVEDCTEQEARLSPWDHAGDEEPQEIETTGHRVISVEANE